ncbi:hypothetical protein C8R48DRAFT_454798 [Suillus tomentosus]|nr:hypothetical protein C8R48DRAFT_454798 [Suillus tomentosus]
MSSAQQSCPCPPSCKCHTGPDTGRNLVVCIDGTSNKFGTKNTNIVRLCSNIVKNDKQLVCYLTGVGTYGRPGGLAHVRLLERATNILDQAIAHNVSRSIMNAYTWLADRYHEGDKIFLFGFSRGAYQVRALAGMIHEVGLIIPGNKDQIPYAFKYYSAIKSGELKDISLAKDFKRTFSTSASVYFVGVWDTVSSIGINSLRNLPSANTCDHIRYFHQALALDELRVKFLPEYVCGGMGERSKSKPGLPPSHEHVKEVWFAGNHSDIGGARSGKAVSHLTLQDMPLLWMCEEVLAAGLLLNNSNIDFAYEDWRGHNIKSSLNVAWWLLEVLPIMHRHHGDNNHTFLPHLGRGRVIFPGQKLHASVLFRSNYQPKAVFWKSFMQWPEAIHFHFAYDQEQLGHAWEVPFKRSTAEAFIGTIHKEHTLNYVDRLAFMCSFELGVEAARKVNALETLEALLSIHGKTIADVKYAPDEKEETSPMSDPKNIDTDAAKEERVNARKQRIHTRKQRINARKVCLSALVAYCVLIKNADEDTERILDSLDVPAMLQDTEYQGRACAALPALCEIKTLREKLLKEDMVGRIVDLCRNTGENKLIAMRTLSYLAQRFDDASLIISRHSDFIDTILVMLREK